MFANRYNFHLAIPPSGDSLTSESIAADQTPLEISGRDSRTLLRAPQGCNHRLTAITAKMASQIASAIAESTNTIFCRAVGGRIGSKSSAALKGFGRDTLLGFRRLAALTATWYAMAAARF
jgi:hypothetical protein